MVGDADVVGGGPLLLMTFFVDWMTDVCCWMTGVEVVVEDEGGVDDVPERNIQIKINR